MTTSDSETLRPRRRGLFRRIVDRIATWFRGEAEVAAPDPPPPPPQPQTEEIVHRERPPETPLTALCRGDVFEFQVYVDLVWSADGMTHDGLTARAAEYGTSAMDTVRDRVWRTARRFPPHQAAEAEDAIQQELDKTWCYSTGASVVRCSAKVRVLPDPRVREHLLKPGYRELDIDAHAGLGAQEADRMEQLTVRWREVLTGLGHEPSTVYAARLAERDFAVIVGQLAEKRRDSVNELINVLRRATKDHEELGLWEFASTYDAALQAFRRQMGLERESAGADDPAAEDTAKAVEGAG